MPPRHPLSATIKFQKLHDEVQLPEYKTEGAAGMDLYAWLPDGKVGISPREVCVVPCGFRMEIPAGYEAVIRPRSGMAIKELISVVNSPGTIDSDYRGEVMVGLINHGTTTFVLEPGTRIAQMVIQAVPRINIQVVDELSETDRGEGRFGSTGQK